MIGTVLGVLIVAAAAVVVGTVRRPADLPPDSPEGLVQRYLRAVADGDLMAIRDTYTPELRRRCEREHAGRRPFFPDARPSFEADLLSTREVDEETAEVRVRITEFSGEPPFGDGYDHTEVFVVDGGTGSWRLADASWPYYVCTS